MSIWRARTRRVLRWAGVSILLFGIVGLGFTVWERNFRRASAANPGMSCPTVVPASHHPPLTSIGVHRVALIGDSLMVQPSCAVAESLAQEGIETGRYAAGGSGLLTGPVDWLNQMDAILKNEHPDIVVAVFVGNYVGLPLRGPDGQVISNNSPAFFAAWQQRARALSDEVLAAGAQMYWVSPPPISLPPLSHAQRLFDGYRTIPGDRVLDSGSVLAGPNGQVVMTKQTCGRMRTIRYVDRVHLTDDGARLYGQQIAHDLTATLGVFTAPKPC